MPTRNYKGISYCSKSDGIKLDPVFLSLPGPFELEASPAMPLMFPEYSYAHHY